MSQKEEHWDSEEDFWLAMDRATRPFWTFTEKEDRAVAEAVHAAVKSRDKLLLSQRLDDWDEIRHKYRWVRRRRNALRGLLAAVVGYLFSRFILGPIILTFFGIDLFR